MTFVIGVGSTGSQVSSVSEDLEGRT